MPSIRRVTSFVSVHSCRTCALVYYSSRNGVPITRSVLYVVQHWNNTVVTLDRRPSCRRAILLFRLRVFL